MGDIKIVLKDKTELLIDAFNFPADIIKIYNSKDEFISTWTLLSDENMSEMSIYENETETIQMTGYTIDSVQAVTNSDGSVTGHFYLRDGQYKSVVVDEVAEAERKAILDKVNEYGGFNTKTVQSDKIGFDWKEEYIGTILLTRTYVQQANPVGTADNPIEYYEGVSLIDNAYYNKDGKTVVYMSGEFIEM